MSVVTLQNCLLALLSFYFLIPLLFLFSLLFVSFHHHPRFFHPSMASESLDTAEHFIYVTQVYFCGKHHWPQCSDKLLLIREFDSHVLAIVLYLLLSVLAFLTFVVLHFPDAVVLWDWIISLPREYCFVSSIFERIYSSLIVLHQDLENSLDASQDGVSLLPVSVRVCLTTFE